MHVYLPIAEISVNILVLLGLGAGVGMMSGIFGVGGGFLMTPLLIFMGIPAPVAVGTEANQIVASSVSGALAHFRRGNVDLKMGTVLLIGGIMGSTFGVWLFKLLSALGQIDMVIRLAYVVFLGIIGSLMMIESIKAIRQTRSPTGGRRRLHEHRWFHGLPFKMRFRRSKLYISALLPLTVGALVGILAAIMGVGTFLQAYQNQTVDILLALFLIVGGVIGAQVGTRVGAKLPGEKMRFLLAAMVVSVCLKMMFDLVSTPGDLYSIALAGGH
jgi:uncharacterized membrane protein YfcA